MRYKGQGAMEYLMTYGWAILVVTILGLALYNMGVFDLGSDFVPTSTGFKQLKPLLASCKLSKPNLWYSGNGATGLTCQFLNIEGRDIDLTVMNFTIDGRTCYLMFVDTETRYTPGKSSYIYRRCNDEYGTCPTLSCVGSRCGSFNGPLKIGKDSVFGITIYSYQNSLQGPCADLKEGEQHTVYVELEYEIMIDDDTVSKRSIGRINIAAE